MIELLQNAAANPELWFALALVVSTLLGYDRVQKVLMRRYDDKRRRLHDLARAAAVEIYRQLVRPEKKNSPDGKMPDGKKDEAMDEAYRKVRHLMTHESISATAPEIREAIETAVNELKAEGRRSATSDTESEEETSDENDEN